MIKQVKIQETDNVLMLLVFMLSRFWCAAFPKKEITRKRGEEKEEGTSSSGDDTCRLERMPLLHDKTWEKGVFEELFCPFHHGKIRPLSAQGLRAPGEGIQKEDGTQRKEKKRITAKCDSKMR